MRSALSFLTILPLGGQTPEGRLGRVWFPVVGALLGLAAGAVFWSLERVLGAPVAAVGAVAALAVLTGGLHLDGLADAADGLLGGSSPERRLEIMRDSRVGVFGAVALVLLLLAEVAALARSRPQDQHLVLTGRGASEAVIDAADLVTEMREVKHHHRDGIPAQRGIEF